MLAVHREWYSYRKVTVSEMSTEFQLPHLPDSIYLLSVFSISELSSCLQLHHMHLFQPLMPHAGPRSRKIDTGSLLARWRERRLIRRYFH